MRLGLISLCLALASVACSSSGGDGKTKTAKAGKKTAIGTPKPGFMGEAPKGAAVAKEGEIGRYGGSLVLALAGDPKTLNPLTANDSASADLLRGPVFSACMNFDRVKQTEIYALCEKYDKSPDGLIYTFTLREGLKWSDGSALTADDFEFSYAVLLDKSVPNAARDLFKQGVDAQGAPRYPTFEKIDARTFRFTLLQKDVLFHSSVSSIYVVPKARWAASHKAGEFAKQMLLNTDPKTIVGSGPFVIKEVQSDERVVLERNPYYWKVDAKGNRLPYLNRVIYLILPDFNSVFLKFREGKTDVLEVRPEHYDPLKRKEAQETYSLHDQGPAFTTSYLAFNQDRRLGKDGAPYVNPIKQKWFQNKLFRKAVSHALDRAGIVRTVMAGRGQPLWTFLSPANKVWWTDEGIHKYPYDLKKAQAYLTEAGFTLKDGKLADADGNHVEFSMMTNAENSTRIGMLNVIKNDLTKLGITAHIRPVPFNDLLNSMRNSRDFDAVLLGWGAGIPPDPSQSKNVLLSSGRSHVWAPQQAKPATPWEARMDALVALNAGTDDMVKRKAHYHELLRIFSDEQPQIQLVVQTSFAAARDTVGNFRPAALSPTTHWNVEQMFKKKKKK
ncbi:MAG: peptide/nickel transport system substrate-binding protein [Bradymonadia bacterium]|jgi:peptide/nickel transport system substrate-binding protein